MKIGFTLKRLRKEANLTQKMLADKCNMSRGYLSDLESDRYNPSIDTLNTIANVLGVSVNEFFNEDIESIKDIKIKHEGEEFDEEIKAIARNMKRLPTDKRKLLSELIKTMSESADEEFKK